MFNNPSQVLVCRHDRKILRCTQYYRESGTIDIIVEIETIIVDSSIAPSVDETIEYYVIGALQGAIFIDNFSKRRTNNHTAEIGQEPDNKIVLFGENSSNKDSVHLTPM